MRGIAAGGRVRLPPHPPGLRIGLYGGSFDPAHAGHRHVALLALTRLGLDRVWWLVTPGNPLKELDGLPASGVRIRAARAVAAHPRMIVTGFEEALGSVYTVETIRFLVRRCPGVRFVWLVGADSFAAFHRWRAWREIARLMPIAVVDRPGWTLRALSSEAARTFAASRLAPARAASLVRREPPAWTFVSGPRSALSSTALRGKSGPARVRRLKRRGPP